MSNISQKLVLKDCTLQVKGRSKASCALETPAAHFVETKENGDLNSGVLVLCIWVVLPVLWTLLIELNRPMVAK